MPNRRLARRNVAANALKTTVLGNEIRRNPLLADLRNGLHHFTTAHRELHERRRGDERQRRHR